MSGGIDRRCPGELPGASSGSRDERVAGKHTLTEGLQLAASEPRQLASGDDGAVQHAAARGIVGGGGPLPHGETIQRLFGRHDVSGVAAHVGGEAETASRAIGAEAYATGHHVAFARAPSLHTAAHEAAHVVQQRGGVQLKGGIGEAGDKYEHHANAVADRVVAGDSAEGLLDAYTPNSSTAPPGAVQRKPDAGGAAASSPSPSAQAAAVSDTSAGQLAHLLAAPQQPHLGGDPVVTYLERLDMPQLLDQLSEATACGYALQLEARVATSPRLGAALQAAELARLARVTPAHPALQRAGAALDHVTPDQQLEILSWMLHRRGVSVEATSLVEGVIAMRAERKDAGPAQDTANPDSRAPGGEHTLGESVDGAVTSVQNTAAGAMAGAPAPIEPGPWAPPGDQPIPFYIGNEAHRGIALEYQAAHGGDVVRTNFFPISSVLRTLMEDLGHTANTGALSDSERGLMPDIVNLSRLHLYEIKPLAAQALGAAKATLSVGIFGRAGIAMTLGPTTEPGTWGGLPAPGGVYMFWSPQPGVIVYQYRKGRLVPVPVPEPEPVRVRRWRFELQPLTRQQQQAVTTLTVGGALLLMAMILLSPVGI